MTRKDFELIASVLDSVVERLNESYPTVTPYTIVRADLMREIEAAFANRLAITNPRFDRSKFLNAAGWNRTWMQTNG